MIGFVQAGTTVVTSGGPAINGNEIIIGPDKTITIETKVTNGSVQVSYTPGVGVTKDSDVGWGTAMETATFSFDPSGVGQTSTISLKITHNSTNGSGTDIICTGGADNITFLVYMPQIKKPFPTDGQKIWYLGGVSDDGPNFQTTATFEVDPLTAPPSAHFGWDIVTGDQIASVDPSGDTFSALVTSKAGSSLPNDVTLQLLYNGQILDEAAFSVYQPISSTGASTPTVPLSKLAFNGIIPYFIYSYETDWQNVVSDNFGNSTDMSGMDVNQAFPDAPVRLYLGSNWNMADLSTGSGQFNNTGNFTDHYIANYIDSTGIPQMIFYPNAGYDKPVWSKTQKYYAGSPTSGAGTEIHVHTLVFCRGEAIQQNAGE